MELIAGMLLFVGAGVALVSLLVVHVLPTGLSPLRDPVSQYGIGRYRGWYWSAAAGAALAGVGGALFFATVPGVTAVVTVILLLIFSISRALIGFFPMDSPGKAKTGTGSLHNLLATSAFGCVTAAAFTGAGGLHDAGFAALSSWSTGCGVVMAVATVGVLVSSRSSRLRGWFGLAERLIYVGFLAWFLSIGVAALT